MSSKKMRTPNWLILALAFLSALLMWYTVTVRDRLEVQLEVRLDYRGVPENMVVVDGLINKMSIRLRGPEALVRSITPQNLNQVVNLSKLKKGTNVIPLTPAEWDPAFR
ncbi:MAG: YbbR-like domain-containing protein, partial [Desulfovibrionaceae bacterium]|nr:YbbR-like domain-containing protein [Desulfovibrionaceae bacterium]